jgi:hypothetical protein
MRRLTCALVMGLGCGGGGHPDSGYGRGAPVPPIETCADLCQRSADCFEHLCDEDTMSTRYDALGSILADQCMSTCTDALLQQKITPAAWQCLFQSSCRQVFESDVCHDMATYKCQ